jgi:hypothetical protein
MSTSALHTRRKSCLSVSTLQQQGQHLQGLRMHAAVMSNAYNQQLATCAGRGSNGTTPDNPLPKKEGRTGLLHEAKAPGGSWSLLAAGLAEFFCTAAFLFIATGGQHSSSSSSSSSADIAVLHATCQGFANACCGQSLPVLMLCIGCMCRCTHAEQKTVQAALSY